MKIALINENSQAAKNEIICSSLRKVVEPMGHEVFNYGMFTAEDEAQLTYVQIGILAAVLLLSLIHIWIMGDLAYMIQVPHLLQQLYGSHFWE